MRYEQKTIKRGSNSASPTSSDPTSGLALQRLNSQLPVRVLNTSIGQWYTDQTVFKNGYMLKN